MKAYLYYFKMRYLCTLQYRTAALAGIFTQVGFGLILILPFYVLSKTRGGSFPMDMESISAYIWLQQAFLMMISYHWDRDIMGSIISGSIAVELCRPMDIYGRWFVQTLAHRISAASLRAGPVLLVAFLLPAPLGLRLPPDMTAFLLFLVSLALGTVVMSAIVLLVYNTTFHTLSSVGIPHFLYSVMDFFGGQIIPIKFYPPALYTLCAILPFGSVSNAPFRIYTGDIAGAEALWTVGLQIFWAVILIAVGYTWTRLALRRVVAQGG